MKTWKKILIAVLIVAAVAGGVVGVMKILGNRGSEVKVYEVMNMAMDSYWGDQVESQGTVRYDRMQAVYLSSTMQVTEIPVQQGDEVKTGDLLMKFDTTLTDIELQRKELAVTQNELDLKNAKKELAEVNRMKPYVPPAPQPEPEPKELHPIPEELLPYIVDESKGTEEDPYVIVVQEPVEYTQEWIEKLLKTTKREIPDETTTEEPTSEEPTSEEPTSEEPTSEEPTSEEPTSEEPTSEEPTSQEPTSEEPSSEEPSSEEPSSEEPSSEDIPNPAPARQGAVIEEDMGQCWAIFQVREENALDGNVLKQWGMTFTKDDNGNVSFSIFEPEQIYLPPEEETTEDNSYIDDSSGYTREQIAQMRKELQDKIRDLDLKLRLDHVELERMKNEIETGEIRATMDGTVTAMVDEETARQENKPMITVSAGGGYLVDGSIGEFQRDTIHPGDQVMISSWQTGESGMGVVEEVSDTPKTDGSYWGGDANPNVSQYGVTIRVEDPMNLQEYEWVSVSFMNQGGQGEFGVYLENPFLRTENGRSYIFVKGENGLLEKRFVRTGKSIWGSYTQILEGLTMEDKIAFPYGRNVRDGAKTVDADISELYQ